MITFDKFYFVDLAFQHHRPSNVFSHGAQRCVFDISWHELHLEQYGHLVKDIDSLKYKQQQYTFVVVLSTRAASAWELLPEISIAKT
jgi:hypothetical protein